MHSSGTKKNGTKQLSRSKSITKNVLYFQANAMIFIFLDFPRMSLTYSKIGFWGNFYFLVYIVQL